MTLSPWDASVRPNPHGLYEGLRAAGPVQPLIGPVTGNRFWFLTSHEAAVAGLRHKAVGKEVEKHLPDVAFEMTTGGFEVIGKSMLFVDPPDHTRLRRLVSAGFTPRSIAALEPRIKAISKELLDTLAGQTEFDLISDYAFKLPVTVIAEMLGVPASDHERFRHWSRALLTGEDVYLAGMEFVSYMNDQINMRRTEPRDDLISGLVHAEDEGETLDHAETLSMILLLLVAGHETTVNLIGNGMRALLSHRSQMERLRTQPELMESAIEELLRFDGPVEISTLRWAFEDVDIAGVTIPRGEIVVPTLLAANRDPAVFVDPHELDIARNPNHHVAFGSGIHLCLGSSLARLEGAVAIGDLLNRFSEIEPAVADEDVKWNEELFLRGMKAYPIAVA